MTRIRSAGRFVRDRWRTSFLIPILAFASLAAWAYASPVGASPDDDFHLASIWCANGGSEYCEPGSQESARTIPEGFGDIACFGQKPDISAQCQEEAWLTWDDVTVESERGNFDRLYPPVYYATMRLAAGDDVQVSAIVMRLLNAALFVALTTALFALLGPARRRTLVWMWLVTLVPLGMFLIPSNNPSGWAITGVGTAFVALLGWFEADGRRRWALGAVYLVGMVMAAGSRGDAAVYAIGATAVVLVLTVARDRAWAYRAIVPAFGLAIAIVLFATASQSGIGATGFGGGSSASPGDEIAGGFEIPGGGAALAAYNVLTIPLLWTGVWGSWGLGWLDTMTPAVVAWAATSAFVVVGFAGLGQLTWRKAINIAGVLFVLIALPVYVLTAGGDAVGSGVQPRYILPLIVLFAGVLITEPRGRALRFSRLQTFTILGALAGANLVALQVNIRRYVTGVDEQGFNLGSGAEWWWSGFPIGPTAVWMLGALAYTALLATLWPHLRRSDPPAIAPTSH